LANRGLIFASVRLKAFGFLTQVGADCPSRLGHHPELGNVYNRVTIVSPPMKHRWTLPPLDVDLAQGIKRLG